MNDPWLVRVRAREGLLLPLADGLFKRRWLRLGVAVMRADRLLFRLGLV
jgi:hypothetical protein